LLWRYKGANKDRGVWCDSIVALRRKITPDVPLIHYIFVISEMVISQ
jgi:hypothetical protein